MGKLNLQSIPKLSSALVASSGEEFISTYWDGEKTIVNRTGKLWELNNVHGQTIAVVWAKSRDEAREKVSEDFQKQIHTIDEASNDY